ncbi:hypothetical protein MKY84_01365 [Chryseomicrobium sp. FSL W7-1435]|uniref:hypothetical protein n=1 Tax=Chryseomicrobium sp. FSL W7-1435 TaxID=2921704 RepID=UPI00315ACE01
MSLATYIGTNQKIPTEEENPDHYDSDFWIGRCFSDETNQEAVLKNQFSTTYAYEISSHWGIEIYEGQSLENQAECLIKLNKLLKITESYVSSGDYFELYSCWLGEESERRESELSIRMTECKVSEIRFAEKTLVRFNY